MDALKALLEKKRSAVPAGKFGDQKFVKQSEVEDLRLKRLREEEEAEKREKVRSKDLTFFANSWSYSALPARPPRMSLDQSCAFK